MFSHRAVILSGQVLYEFSLLSAVENLTLRSRLEVNTKELTTHQYTVHERPINRASLTE